jgi:hypothetical protein
VEDELASEAWIFISDSTSHSNQKVNYYLAQIYQHYDALYVLHDFGHISYFITVCDNCTEQFKSKYQMAWGCVFVEITSLLALFMLFLCPQHGKGIPDGIGGNVKFQLRMCELFQHTLPTAMDIYLWLRDNYSNVANPGESTYSYRKRHFRFVPNGMVPRHHAIEASDFKGISNFYNFAIRKEDPIGTIHARFAPDACGACLEGDLWACENLEFLGGWEQHFIEVVRDVDPSPKEDILELVSQKLAAIREAKVAPFFIMYVEKNCPSPSIAMVTADSRLFLRQISVYALKHHQKISPNQFNETKVQLVHVCQRRLTQCNCNKLHKTNLSLEQVLQICVVEKGGIFKSVFAKCKGGIKLGNTHCGISHSANTS